MEKAIEIVETKIQMIESIIDNLGDNESVKFFIPRKLILQDVLKELKAVKNKYGK